MTHPRPALAVVGPTAAGKSDLAVAVALALGGEVLNADSMQLYRGMDVGTAKLTPPERRGVPHHLLDVWDVRETASVATYQGLALRALADTSARGVPALLVGGSGLYVRAVVDRIEFPGTDPVVRGRLEAELADEGPAPLHARLARLDPAAAAVIQPANRRRLVRALEVVEITGRPYAATLPPQRPASPVSTVGLDVPRPVLDARIEARVDRMLAGGLVDEVERLAGQGLRDGSTASRALGYAQVLRVLDGEWTLAQARDETVRATRRFVRRQDSWFRRDPGIVWLPYDAPDLLERAVAVASAP